MKSWLIIIAIIIFAFWLMIMASIWGAPQGEETRTYLEARKFTSVNIYGRDPRNCPDWIWHSTMFSAIDSTSHNVQGVLCKTFNDSIIIRFF